MSTRGVISSFAESSERRRTPSIISESFAETSPCATADSRTETSSSSERARRSRSSAGANARDVKRRTTLNGVRTARQNPSRTAYGGASGSANLSARRFGVISQKTRRTTVIAGTASQGRPGIHRAKSR